MQIWKHKCESWDDMQLLITYSGYGHFTLEAVDVHALNMPSVGLEGYPIHEWTQRNAANHRAEVILRHLTSPPFPLKWSWISVSLSHPLREMPGAKQDGWIWINMHGYGWNAKFHHLILSHQPVKSHQIPSFNQPPDHLSFPWRCPSWVLEQAGQVFKGRLHLHLHLLGGPDWGHRQNLDGWFHGKYSPWKWMMTGGTPISGNQHMEKCG